MLEIMINWKCVWMRVDCDCSSNTLLCQWFGFWWSKSSSARIPYATEEKKSFSLLLYFFVPLTPVSIVYGIVIVISIPVEMVMCILLIVWLLTCFPMHLHLLLNYLVLLQLMLHSNCICFLIIILIQIGHLCSVDFFCARCKSYHIIFTYLGKK